MLTQGRQYPSTTESRSGDIEAGTSAEARPVTRAAMQIAVAAAAAQSIVGRLTASHSTSSPSRLAYSNSAWSFP